MSNVRSHTISKSGSAGLRVGLLGGSFNPAHRGHLAMSLFALRRLKLDQIWWLVSPQNPLKNRDEMLSFENRIHKAKELVERHNKIIVTDMESKMKTCFTIDSLSAIKRRFSKTKFVWLMGQDNLKTIHLWKKWQSIFLELPIAVFLRSGYSDSRTHSVAETFFAKARLPLALIEDLVKAAPPAWVVLDNRRVALSATQIRRRGKAGPGVNKPNEGVLTMAAKKKTAKKPVKKAVKKPAKKTAKKKTAKKK